MVCNHHLSVTIATIDASLSRVVQIQGAAVDDYDIPSSCMSPNSHLMVYFEAFYDDDIVMIILCINFQSAAALT